MIPPGDDHPDPPDPEYDDPAEANHAEAEHDRRSVLPLAIALVVAAVVVVGAVVLSVVTGRGSGEFGWFAYTPGGSEESAVSTDLSEVVVVEQPTTRHLDGDVTYDQTPPAGGDHAPAWLECGVYDEPVPDENAVHSLEHGTVWVTYGPGLDEADIDALAATLPEESIVSPYDDLPSPVVVSVWGAQLALTGPDDPRLALFVAEYGDGHTSPEPFASCAGGVTGDEASTVGA